MNKYAILHRAKSEYAYAYNENTLHITIRVAKNDLKEIQLIYGDPFEWKKTGWVKQIKPMIKKYQTSLFDYYFLSIESRDLRVKYAFLLTDNNNKNYFYGSKTLVENYHDNDLLALQNYFNFPYINHEDLHHTPDWVSKTVWYQIFLDRFYTKNPLIPFDTHPVNNNQIFGGNLQGVIAKIPYLKDLGITGIYFTPIFEAKTAHKYDTINYFKIDPSFGTNEDFKELVDKCHEAGIKVMLDGVFNHSGFLHPYFQDVVEKGEESIYKNSFYIDKFPVVNFPLNDGQPQIWKGGMRMLDDDHRLNFRTFAYTPHMPKWKTDDPLTEKHLLDVITYWIKEYNIDGWRLDVSNEISHEFLRKIKDTSRKANPNTFILGENWDQSLPWLMGDQMDSVMNYDLAYPIWEYLEHKIDLFTFKDIVNTYLALTPKNVMANMFNLVDSHDTVRILRRLDDNIKRTKIAYLLMFVSKGAPNIYYGGEIGLTGNHDPDNRRPMIWEQDQQNLDLFNFIKTLIILRNKYPEFTTSDYNFISDELLAFSKGSNDNLIVVVNNSKETKEFTLDNKDYLNLITNKTINCDKITLEAYDFVLLLRK